LFWLACAAIGFAAAACTAFVLSLAIDHQAIWRDTTPAPMARVWGRIRPHGALSATSPVREAVSVSPG
jgi:hypothetical protein